MTGKPKTPDVEVYRRPTDGHWVAICWVKGCRWSLGTTAREEETYVRQAAKNHRSKHARAGDRGEA